MKYSKSLIKNLPETPGVYTFLSEKVPIYVGKAINLKTRVASYFDNKLFLKTKRMVETADEIIFTRVTSELEAFLLEAKLIRQNQPKYNVISKDDKHPLYITITKDDFPKVITSRREGTFGPFPNSEAVKSVLRLIRRVFPYSDHKIGKRACIYSHMGLCKPCPNEIKSKEEQKEYLLNIKRIKLILSSKFIKIQKDLEKEMELASNEQNFEKAIVLREQINKLNYITQPKTTSDAFVENPNLVEDIRNSEIKNLKLLLTKNLKLKIKNLTRIECYDVSHLAGVKAAASMVVFINGEAEKSEYRHFKIMQNNTRSDFDSMKEISKRRMANTWDKPNLVIVDGGLSQIKAFDVPFSVVGIAKNPDRLIFPDGNKVRLQGPTLQLVSRIRDEAHRFARRLHHKLITKSYILN